MSPPSTLRTERPVDPAEQSINEDPAPTLQQLIRLQIFTPMTLLLALGSNLVTVFAFHPGVGQIQDEYETIWTARKELIGGYLLLVSVEMRSCVSACLPSLPAHSCGQQLCFAVRSGGADTTFGRRSWSQSEAAGWVLRSADAHVPVLRSADAHVPALRVTSSTDRSRMSWSHLHPHSGKASRGFSYHRPASPLRLFPDRVTASRNCRAQADLGLVHLDCAT